MKNPSLIPALLAVATLAGPYTGHAAAPTGSAPTPTSPTHNTCPATDNTPPSWRTPTALTAATNEAALPKATLSPGQAARIHLANTANVYFAHTPARPDTSTDTSPTTGGMIRFTVPAAGTWRVMLGSRAWIDVLSNGTAIPSTAHHHGPACSGIGKVVEFSLTPGTLYTLQLSGSSKPEIEVMIAPAQ
ncbi:hypothetical protein [Acetobacter oeni]|uniref:Homogentisate 1,2-dioxygenase n=1 Tax=Acetobacter oeni TaxID=304077 RepID=A0A511XH59_9PROT|nr:hypothetical protein [Acetobacter oeni]MBB3882431.1 hypothetical protein [Acetobacter oeni]NHO18475.1 hypothetical protein [Acetobacter oeni]GBR00448.1 hypothetical protein AA21952_0102 [Acetobacter oeni LMG 21952]GEN62287.1 hypothetical protein AOE01nite_05110 [Acetobacter oeni]